MKIGTLNWELNRWQLGIAFGKAPDWQVRFLNKQPFRFIHIWCMKLTSFPNTGQIIEPRHFKGLRFYKEFPMK